MKKKQKIIIGRLERVSFPELDMQDIAAKIDTGAFSSTIHCHDIYELRDGQQRILCFKLLDPNHPLYNSTELKFSQFEKCKVKSSSGHVEKRYKIKTRLSIGNLSFLTEFTLTDRSKMKYPVLLGRRALGRFLIDTKQKNVLSSS